ncbi:hypothetical protein Tco_1058486 [Tanacetum coccineum]|uniref:Uncharacterized protein n=1 Tax=Tanacetum coccineum TaxID=301880 RepID=A0ABQ5H8I7_9ASTR
MFKILKPIYIGVGKFTSDGESLESYYSRFYKMMNELVQNQCHVTNHQVNVQFLLQLQPEWQRFCTLVSRSQELKTFTIIKPIHSKHLIFLKPGPDPHISTRNRGKAIVTSSAPIYDQEPLWLLKMRKMSRKRRLTNLMALISSLVQEKSTNHQQQPSKFIKHQSELIKIILNNHKELGMRIRGQCQSCWAEENVDSEVTARFIDNYERNIDDEPMHKTLYKSQLEIQKTPFLNERPNFKEYYYADHMNAILGVYTDLDEVTNLQCDYLETSEKCERLEKELSNVAPRKLGYNVVVSLAVSLIGLGRLELSESDHDP